MIAFYNDNDPKACVWLQALQDKDLISHGRIDNRSIAGIQAYDLQGADRVHLFAGIGGWDLALQLAGWPTDRPVWTGSCPCQPFSAAGKRKAQGDARHLWPEMFRLIRECRPDTVFGEQVPGAIGLGWLDGVFADLEGEGYTCGAVVLGAHSVGAPHIRQRLYWVAQSKSAERRPEHQVNGDSHRRDGSGRSSNPDGLAVSQSGDGTRIMQEQSGKSTIGSQGMQAGGRSQSDGMGDAQEQRRNPRRPESGRSIGVATTSGPSGMALANGRYTKAERQQRSGQQRQQQQENSGFSGLGNPSQGTGQRDSGAIPATQTGEHGQGQSVNGDMPVRSSDAGSGLDAWTDSTAILCRDSKYRRIPTQPALFPLVDGPSPGRVGLLRGAGNAIVPQVAAVFIKAFLECESESVIAK
jgi:DNA (cytosine-5)-methyltransferase 1